MAEYEPVRSVEDFRTIDEGEALLGYLEGLENAPECTSKWTRSFWHGWHCGLFDGGHRAPDEAHHTLRAALRAAAS